MSRPMTLQEFANVVNHIQQHNGPFAHRRKADGTYLPCVKYMDPVIAFGQERKPYDWMDPQFGYEVEEISLEEAKRVLTEQAWADTEPAPLA